MRLKDEHYNEAELGPREYIRRLEVELAAKNRQIRLLQEALGTLAWTADDSDGEPQRPRLRLIQGGLPALLGAALAVSGTAAAVMAAAVLSAPSPAVRAPMRLVPSAVAVGQSFADSGSDIDPDPHPGAVNNVREPVTLPIVVLTGHVRHDSGDPGVRLMRDAA